MYLGLSVNTISLRRRMVLSAIAGHKL